MDHLRIEYKIDIKDEPSTDWNNSLKTSTFKFKQLEGNPTRNVRPCDKKLVQKSRECILANKRKKELSEQWKRTLDKVVERAEEKLKNVKPEERKKRLHEVKLYGQPVKRVKTRRANKKKFMYTPEHREFRLISRRQQISYLKRIENELERQQILGRESVQIHSNEPISSTEIEQSHYILNLNIKQEPPLEIIDS